MRVIDLTSGRVLAAQHVEGKATLSSQSGYPSDQEAVDQAEKVASESVHRIFFPWTETKTVLFYNDSQCGLNVAHNLLRSKDLDGALQKAKDNLDGCHAKTGVKPSLLAHAYYDVGILQFLKGDYDSALTNLSQAGQLDSSRVILDATADCRTAKESATALAQRTDRAPPAIDDHGGGSPHQVSVQSTGLESAEERLRRLDDLLKKKLITKDEYSQQRAKILSEM
jgi:hypothetical protein